MSPDRRTYLWSTPMRRLALLVLFGLLGLTAGCGKKPDAAPDVGIAIDPAPNPELASQAKESLTELDETVTQLATDILVRATKKWPPKPVDANNFAGKSLAQWREDLKSKNRVKIIHAMKVMQVFGPQAADAIPDILAADRPAGNLNDPNEFHDWFAFVDMDRRVFPEVVSAVGKPALPHLLAGLDVTEEDLKSDQRKRQIRGRSLDGLKVLGPDAAEAAPKVAELVNHKDPQVQLQAFRTLLQIAPPKKLVISACHTMLKSPDRDARLTAAEILGILDPVGSADDALPVLLDFIQPQLTEERVSKALALFGAKSVTALMDRVTKLDGKPNKWILNILKYFKPKDLKPIIPDMIAFLDAVPEDERWFVLEVIKAAGPEAKAALPKVLELARAGKARDPLETAAKIGVAPEDFLPIIRNYCEKPNTGWPTKDILLALGPKVSEVLPLLRTRLADPQEKWRYGIASELVTIAPTSPEVCGVLLELKAFPPDDYAFTSYRINAPSYLARLMPILGGRPWRVTMRVAEALVVLADGRPP